MDQQKKRTLAAVFIAALMVFSVAGFAISGFRPAQAPPPQDAPAIPFLANRSYTSNEIALILGAGRVIIESVYNPGCGPCAQQDQQVRAFALAFPDSIFLSSYATTAVEGFERFRMIGSRGEVVDLQGRDLSPEGMLDVFCTISLLQPRECLLRVYTRSPPPEPPPIGNETNNQTNSTLGGGNQTMGNGTGNSSSENGSATS
ncbi:MAG: hypothetical protein HY520_04185 [Candidatus Aenigmarchaeota archaeon]|nr:hypothetical protein [Candidatus Aenigmarchaeota archaeon]